MRGNKKRAKGVTLAMAYSRMQKPHTTIGAGGLNCRVRDGTGWTPAAQITNIHTLCPSFTEVTTANGFTPVTLKTG